MGIRGDGWTIRPDGSIVYDATPSHDPVVFPYQRPVRPDERHPLESIAALASLVAIVAVIGAVIMSGRLIKARQLELMLTLARQTRAA